MKPTAPPGQTRKNRVLLRIVGRVALWVTLVPVVLMAALYVTLLITPVPVPFLRDQVQALVHGVLPPSSRLELGDMSLALEGGSWPVFQFSPVTLTDTKSGAKIGMRAFEVGFSPVRAIVGQPGMTVTMVAPHVQINQDLFGPRLTSFQVVPDPEGGKPTVRVLEGQDAFPAVGISSEGLDIRGNVPAGQTSKARSDNDWLIYNLEAAQESIASIVQQASLGRFSRLIIRDGALEMNDALYGLFRTFDHISIDVTPGTDGVSATGNFKVGFGGHTMSGLIERTGDPDGTVRFKADVANMDFTSFMPFINDPDSIAGVEGTGALSMDIHYTADGKILDGTFRIDMTGTELRLQGDHFPIATSIIAVKWLPATGRFDMAPAQVSVGQSSGTVSGTYVLGLDPQYGPTVGMSVSASDVVVHPYDLDTPGTPFTSMKFVGWSAPLYGALGIDQFTAEKPGVRLASKGRADVVRNGLGFDMTVGAEGVTADDLKRLWPYFIAPDSRKWFVDSIGSGTVTRATMKYDFPIGSIGGAGGDNKPLPPDSVSIDMVASGVQMELLAGMPPIAIDGSTRLWVRDAKVTVAADGAKVPTDAGEIGFANAALVMDSDAAGLPLIEISGDVSGKIPAIVALAKGQQPEAIANAKLPLDLDALGGDVALTLVSTIRLDKAGAVSKLDYALNGTVVGFGSTKPIETHSISGGQLSFTASQESYRIAGQAQVDGIDADLIVEGTPDASPSMLISSTMDVADLKSVGLNMSEFLSGTVKFVGRPMPDGTIQLAIDITDATLDIEDLGIRKPKGKSGMLEAQVKQTGTLAELTHVSLEFGDVKLHGAIDFDLEEGLVSADFTTFALSPGDDAQVSLTTIAGGYQLKLRGNQLDLKPMLKRFFGLGEGSGGPRATVFTQTLVLDAQLDRALGFYKTTAINLDLNLTLKGTDLQKVSLQTQFGNGRSVSVTTNPGPQGKVMSVAFNDLGTLLRLLNIYPNIEGGEGSLVLQDTKSGDQNGEFIIRKFSIVDEAKVAEIVGGGSSRQASGPSTMNFRSGKVNFVRRKDRVEITDGLLSGDSVGGTVRGFIYTDNRQYDLTGTYVPFYGLNSVWQKLPLLGPLLGGRNGEGLFGVAFAIKGPLDKPEFKINPLSALLPGAFRTLFEFRAKEQPRAE